jgi:hypothetical protein
MIDKLDISRRGALGLMSASMIPLAGMPSAFAAAALPDSQATILGNEAQIAAEKIALRMLHDPDVVALREKLGAELATWPRGQGADAADRIETCVLQMATGLIIDEMNYLQAGQPIFLIGDDTSPRRWFGHTFPGNGKAADNPDAIYRTTVVDGRGRYEVTGKLDPSQPLIQLVFSLSAGTMAHPIEVKPVAGGKPNPDAGIMRITGTLNEGDLKIARDGSFRILVGGPKPADGTPYLATEPVPCSFGCRQMLLDWTTTPLRLSIRRLDPYTPTPLDLAALKRAVLADLPGSVRFWAKFPDVWLGGVATNKSVPPAARDGGWGFICGANFKLEPGEGALVTVHPGKARYMGFQLTDPWMVGPDNGRRQCCLNLAQSVPDADGRFTNVIAPVDPGVANWLDTCGMNEGFGIMRWQGFPDGATDNSGLFDDFRIVKLSEIEGLKGVARVTPEQRSQQLAARQESYFSRFRAV